MLWPKGQCVCGGGGGIGGGEGAKAITHDRNLSVVAVNNLKEGIIEILRILG